MSKIAASLLAVFLLLLLSAAFLSLFYFSTFRYGNIGFVSTSPALKWQVATDKFIPISQAYGKFMDGRRVLIRFSDNFKATDSSAGWFQDRPAIYHAEWKIVSGIDILEIFMNRSEWQAAPNEGRDTILGYFISDQILERFGRIDPDLAYQSLYASEGEPVLSIIERF